jgi:hypothetical protein
MNMKRVARTVVTAVSVVLTSSLLTACGGQDEASENIAAINVRPDQVQRVIFTDGDVSTEIRRVDDDWLPGKNIARAVESIALLGTAEDRLFPTNAYRIMEDVDQNDPNYGLNRDAERTIEVFDTDGKRWRLSVGRPSFNQAGYYAKVDGDPRVYLIISKTVSDIISIANGKLFEFDPIDKIKFVDTYFDRAAREGTKGNETPDYDPWLNQVLAARSGDKAKLHEAARKSSSILGPEDKGKIKGEGAPKGPLVDRTADLSRSAVAPGAQ